MVGTSIPNTIGTIGKPNGSMVFYHDGFWWGVFRRTSDSDWTIWKKDADVWSDTGVELHDRGSDRPDAVIDSTRDRLWSLGRHSGTPELSSATYAAGVWTIDVLRQHAVGINGEENSSLAVAREWATPTVFAFEGESDSEISFASSDDNGATWSALSPIADASDGRTTDHAHVDSTDFRWMTVAVRVTMSL